MSLYEVSEDELIFNTPDLTDLSLARAANSALLELLNNNDGEIKVDMRNVESISGYFVQVFIGSIVVENFDWLSRIGFLASEGIAKALSLVVAANLQDMETVAKASKEKSLVVH